MQAPASLIADLETAVSGRSEDQRATTLKRIADLFFTQADRVNAEHIGVFDDVLLCLVKTVETDVMTQLGRRLAPIDNAPTQVLQHLARHDDIAVAAPVLSRAHLSSDDLADIARTKSQEHLHAISKRPVIDAKITEVIVERGDREVVQSLVANAGASFSDKGFARLAARAEGDDRLSEQVGLRPDMPSPLLRELMQKTTEAVQTRLLAFAPLETREEIHRIVVSISTDVVRQAAIARGYAQAEEIIAHLRKTDEFGESSILEFAKMRKYEEMIVGLAQLCAVPVGMIDRLMKSPRHEGLLIACRAAGIKWLTVGAVLTSRFAQHSDIVEELRKAKADYNKLSVAAAQKTLKFFLARESAAAKAR